MTSAGPIRIGILHSSTGTMALNETSLRDVILMEVARVNAAGGLLGRPIEPIAVDPASDWMLYRDMAHALIHEHAVSAIFGCWTSVSRKAVLPVVEQSDSLLFYPLQYEGEEQSPNVFYLGATPNQQAIPALEFLMSAVGGAFSRFFFLGTDYVYPRTTNRVLRSFLQAKGMSVAHFPEHYVPFGHHDWAAEVEALQRFQQGGRGAIVSTLNGDSNLSFYKALRTAGFRADDMPVMALSVSEAELQWLEPADIVGHYACWDYFMSNPAPDNQVFLKAWHQFTGDDRPTYDPMVGALLGFRLWCKAVTAAGTTATAAVRQYMLGQTETALNASTCVMGVNHHIEMAVSVGRATADRQFEIVWRAPRPVAGDPWAAANIIAEATAANAQRELLDALPTPLIVLDDDGAVLYRSISTDAYFGSTITPAQLASLRQVTRELEAGTPGSDPSLPEITVVDAAGRARHMTVAVRRMVFAGAPAQMLSLADVTYIREIEEQLRLLNTELQRLASTDALTGVNNRRYFITTVTLHLQGMHRHRRPASMFILDLDHFKSLNDRYGHETGDHALVQAAAAVQNLLRGHDTFARIGGEEFAGFLPETELDDALRVAERLRAGVGRLRLNVGGEEVSFTCSIGVTAVLPDGDSPENAMKRADEALYLAKNAGRDRVRQR